jgi:hypothetical protein
MKEIFENFSLDAVLSLPPSELLSLILIPLVLLGVVLFLVYFFTA